MYDDAGRHDMERRRLLRAAAAITGTVLLGSGRLWAAARAGTSPPGDQGQLLRVLCDLVIPATDTPGAADAGVPAFVELAAAHELKGAAPDLVRNFDAALASFAGSPFLQLQPVRRIAVLSEVDSHAFSTSLNDLPHALQQWPILKSLIVIGYYTSQVGGSRELQYVLTPGRFDPDVPCKPGDRDYSSDWVGVKYA